MPRERPNVVSDATERQWLDTVAALGFDYLETPNLDRHADEGVTYTNCHVTASSCVPSRASPISGYCLHTTGIYRNGDRWRHGWIDDPSDSGYYTVYVGEMHTAPYDTSMGFDERYIVENEDRYLATVYSGIGAAGRGRRRYRVVGGSGRA